MPWLVFAGAVLAIVFFNFGAMSAWLAVLSIALKLVLLVVVGVGLGIGVMFLWRRYKGPNRA